jgi:hypothetical protein
MAGPVAANLINVADWDHDGVYHEIHEIAYVYISSKAIIVSESHANHNLIEFNTHYHRNPTSQSRLRTPQTIPETARSRNDHMPITSHDNHVALHDRVYYVGRTEDFMGMLITLPTRDGVTDSRRYQHS